MKFLPRHLLYHPYANLHTILTTYLFVLITDPDQVCEDADTLDIPELRPLHIFGHFTLIEDKDMISLQLAVQTLKRSFFPLFEQLRDQARDSEELDPFALNAGSVP